MIHRAILSLLLLAALCAPALWADADADYKAIQDAALKSREYAKALDLAERFVVKYPADTRVLSVLNDGATCAQLIGEYERALPMFRRVAKESSRIFQVAEAEREVGACLRDGRMLEELLEKCGAMLKDPKCIEESWWLYLKAESLFRLWRFKEAEIALKSFVENQRASDYWNVAADILHLINPSREWDENGVVKDYNGKFVKDVRFRRVLKLLPEIVQSARHTLEDTLGVELPADCAVCFRFVDVPTNQVPSLDRAFAETFSRDYKPMTCITFYAEYVVLDSDDFAQRLTHELKHAAFRVLMGQKYLALPDWIKEGMAAYGAHQTDDRVAYILSNAVACGSDPYKLLDGVAETNVLHDGNDYLEDAVTFEWLQSLRAGNVRTFCKRLIAGEDYKMVFACLSGLEFGKAMDAAESYCKSRIKTSVGGNFAAISAPLHSPVRLQQWLADNPGSALTPNARYFLGARYRNEGEYVEARKYFTQIRAEIGRTSVAEDAAYEYAHTFELAKDEAGMKREYGIFLRDYSWSRHASLIDQKYKPAGPVTEEDEKAEKERADKEKAK